MSRRLLSASCNFEVVMEIRRKCAQGVERRHLELASPLTRHPQHLPDLYKRPRALPSETEAQFEYETEASVEQAEDRAKVFVLQPLGNGRFRMNRVRVLEHLAVRRFAFWDGRFQAN